jgi:hypothetical protein
MAAVLVVAMNDAVGDYNFKVGANRHVNLSKSL